MVRLLFILLLLSGIVNAQFTTGKFTLQGYGTYNYMSYVPVTSAGKVHTVIFIPGRGESNTNVDALYTYGPLGYIRNGWRPDFAIIGIQPFNGGPANYKFVVNALDSLIKNPKFKFDINRYSLTGLSNGAAAIFYYISNTPGELFRPPASVVPMSITTNAQCGDFYQNNDYLCGTDFRYSTIPAWGFAGNQDSHFGKMKRFFQRLIEGGYPAKWTTYTGGHSGWGTFYNPEWKENGESIYDFMVKWTVGGVLPLKLLSFKFMGDHLYWETEQEDNISHFEVEASINGYEFRKFGIIEPKATSQGKTIYTWYGALKQ